MVNTKMCNVRTYVTHEYEMFSVRTYITYENIICAKLCYTGKYDVWRQNLCYIRKCVMSISVYLFQNLDLGIASADDKLHLAIPMSRSYRCVCKISSQYSTQFKRYGHFNIFRIWSSAMPRPMINVILSVSMCLQNFIKIFQTV